jgi:hypothetical protein
MKTGRLEIDSNAWDDPASPVKSSIAFIAVQGAGAGAAITALPMSINFGTVPIGGPAVSRNLVLQNSGTAPLNITGISFMPSSMEATMSMSPMLPTMVQPGGNVMATFSYLPTRAGMLTGHVTIMSNDRSNPTLTVPVLGIGGTPATCSISVTPAIINFGVVERGHQATLGAQVHNGGSQPCNVSNAQLMGAPQFSLGMGTSGTINIQPGATQPMQVKFLPDNYGMYHTVLSFTSDDPTQMTVTVPIDGSSAQTNLLVVPSSLDFGVVPATCHSPAKIVTLYNVGASPITVTSVYLDPTTPPSFVLTPYTTPTTIPAGGQSVITLHYNPSNIGRETGVLFIQHSASMAPVAVPLSGDGEVNAVVTDTFHQATTPQADILFVIDTSASMGWPQTQLGMNIQAFLRFAMQQNIDYHLAVTTTDDESSGMFLGEPCDGSLGGGCERGSFVTLPGQPAVITPQTPNGTQLFTNIVTGLGTSESSLERGLVAAQLALSDPLINTANRGFLRQDATLAVIIVSDDDDSRSDNANGGGHGANPGGPSEVLCDRDPDQPCSNPPRAVDFYVNFFRNIKGFQNQTAFSLSAVVEINENDCLYPNGNRAETAGWRYQQVAMQTGGQIESICGNWGNALNNIGLNSFGLKRQFPLSSAPVPQTIAVSVNGNPVSMPAWSYDSSSNSVVFDQGSAPPAGATITVTYSVACL